MGQATPQFDQAFPANYEVETSALSTPTEQKIWFSPETSDGPCARIIPQSGNPWFGYFPIDKSTHDAVPYHSTPDPNYLFYHSFENTIVVPTRSPDEYRQVGGPGTVKVVAAPSVNLLLLVDYTNIAACDGRQIVWRSDRLSWDGFDKLRVDDDQLHGLAWDSPKQKWTPFSFNLETQKLQGGPKTL